MPRYSLIDEKLVYKLIEEVKKRECLYNNNLDSDRSQANRLTVLKSWFDVAAEVGMSETLVKQKWKSLRDTFCKETRRFGSPDSYTGKWRFYKLLTFIYEAQKKPEDSDETDNESDIGEPEYLDEEAETVSNFIKTERGSNFGLLAEDPLKTQPMDSIPKKRCKYSGSFETQSDDFDVMFLKSLTPFFKQLEPLRKLVVRNKIQEMLLSELSVQINNKKKS